MLSEKDRLLLRVQLLLNWLFFWIIGIITIFFVRHVRGYRFEGMSEIRRRYRELMAVRRPTLICSNHLTMYDSLYIHHALSSLCGYFFRFRLMAWNIPAVENFKSTLQMKIYTYLGKCVPIDREGDSAHHQKVLAQIKYLLSIGETCMIFPEGGRSRSGRIEPENVTYGAGQILSDFPDGRVLCVYMRGESQTSYGHLPKKGEKFYFAMSVLEPRTDRQGLRAARDISKQIIFRLKEMEDEYFTKIQGREAS